MAEAAETWTVLKLINWTKEFFEKARLENPRLCAEMLLAHVLQCPRIGLYTRFDYQPSPAELAEFRELVGRARKFEPVAYLVGEKEFYSRRFKVTPDVLVPRSETELLVREAVEHLRPKSGSLTAWDVCTGSGCVGIALATQVKDLAVLATDISPKAVEVATENAQSNQVAGRVRCRVSDLLTVPEDCRDLAPFEVITGNPPYISVNQMISETVKHEPSIALWGGKDGMDLIGPILAKAPDMLRSGGALIMEFGYAMADAVRDAAVATGQFREPRILRDHQEIERAMVALRK
jgi:release factor glutamine methyltransferase